MRNKRTEETEIQASVASASSCSYCPPNRLQSENGYLLSFSFFQPESLKG